MPDGVVPLPIDAPSAPRVLLLAPSLQGGGAERVAVNLMNGCDPGLVDLRLGLLQGSGPYLQDVDPERVSIAAFGERFLQASGSPSSFLQAHRLALGAAPALINIALMIRRLKPDLVVSFIKGMNLIAGAALTSFGRRRPPWIVREGNNTLAVIEDELSADLGRRLLTHLTRRCYLAADRVVATSRGLAHDLELRLGLDPRRLKVIHNPIDLDAIARRALQPITAPPEGPFVVAAGRLEHQKGHDLLIRAFATSRRCAGHQLVILGEGSRLEALKALARELGVIDRLRFPGFVANPWAWFARAQLFVLPSRWEGFGNVVAEALACGAPALVTDCGYGPAEIVEHGRSGWVVRRGDAAALAAGMDVLLQDPGLMRRLGEAGRRRAREFDIQGIVMAYTRLFLEHAAGARTAPAALPAAWAEPTVEPAEA